MPLSSRTKIRVARLMSGAIRGARRALGRDSRRVLCRRCGVTWELDLSEGVDLAIFVFGRFERATSMAFTRLVRPGMTVFDIGANIGGHTLPLAGLVGSEGRVVAVEPTRWAFSKLTRNAGLNPDLAERIELLNAAIVDETDRRPVEFHARWTLTSPGGSDARRHPVHLGILESAGDAAALTLDELTERAGPPDLMKVDVDGHEYSVLGGGGRTLSEHRPHILIELCPYLHREPDRDFAALVSLLLDAGYDLFDERGARLPHDPGELERLVPEGGSINALASPREAG
jgi:FkbM family methyltransferase